MSSKKNDYKFGNLNLSKAKEVSDYAADYVSKTEKLVTDIIPEKIFKLEKLDENEFSPVGVVLTEDVDIDPTPFVGLVNNGSVDGIIPNSKKRKLEVGNDTEVASKKSIVPCHKRILRLIDLIKPEIQDVIETCEKLQMWIQLLIPRIEDGNNFGVSIQEEVLNEIHRIQSESMTYLDSIARYYITRAKIVSKLIKYPFIDDYRRAVKEIDDKEYMNLKFGINETKSHYMVMLDLISKNYEKIKTPRSQNNLNAMY